MEDQVISFVYGYGHKIEDALKKAQSNIVTQIPTNMGVINKDLQFLVKDDEWCAVLKITSRKLEAK